MARRPWWLAILFIGAAAGAPFLLSPVLIMQAACFALFACAFNLVFGVGGMLSFGHAAFFGAGAYCTAYLMKDLALASPLLAILAGSVLAGLLGLVFGLIATRRQGVYLAMITLSLAEVVSFAVHQLPLGGEDGLQGVPRGVLLGLIDLKSTTTMYVFVLGICGLSMLALYRVVNSPFGQTLRAIKENEARAVSLGCNVVKYKVAAFVISAFFAGLAGGTKALAFHFAALGDVHWHKSGEVVLMTLLGGMGTFFGPMLGAAVVVALSDLLAFLNEWVSFMIGAVFLLCVLLFREGILGALYGWMAARERAAASAAETAARSEGLTGVRDSLIAGMKER